ncbi:16S rRNA (cytidine(1402)-2'-O)-methyltransferase [Candidatus Kaiserbacteria bacterium]|nr:16S rRNA (cytidine(1402)-2'-O)-methyltransferase [Candidatus Kaiserbacteria bacterium]
MAGKLSVVATPIGNFGDLTFRALWNLKECNVVYAEDTRVTLKLLNHYGLRKPIFRLDAAVEAKKADEVVARLKAGEHVVYVSDAGTPGISDPGARLVSRVREELPGATIETVPGASALTAALSIAGIRADQFLFLGFLPHKKGRQTSLKRIAISEMPVVLYESPHRIMKLLQELERVISKRTIIVARELTKMHEEVLLGTASELARQIKTAHKDRGEFVVIVDP